MLPAVGRLEASGFGAALDQLGALSDTARASARWWQWSTRLDDTGRVTLPPLAQAGTNPHRAGGGVSSGVDASSAGARTHP
jgi:hypothetical protein